jgi:hypothetical protein
VALSLAHFALARTPGTETSHTLERAMDENENPQVEKVLKIAQEDQRRRAQAEAEHWDAEYNFWHKIITEEVERLRFNGGYEPISIDLYPSQQKAAPDFQGKTQVGHVRFNVTADWARDSNGVKILRVRILKAA